jgi:hypothetical protein
MGCYGQVNSLTNKQLGNFEYFNYSLVNIILHVFMSSIVQQWSLYCLDFLLLPSKKFRPCFCLLVMMKSLTQLGCGRNWSSNHFSFENHENHGI